MTTLCQEKSSIIFPHVGNLSCCKDLLFQSTSFVKYISTFFVSKLTTFVLYTNVFSSLSLSGVCVHVEGVFVAMIV